MLKNKLSNHKYCNICSKVVFNLKRSQYREINDQELLEKLSLIKNTNKGDLVCLDCLISKIYQKYQKKTINSNNNKNDDDFVNNNIVNNDVINDVDNNDNFNDTSIDINNNNNNNDNVDYFESVESNLI
jgi:hypothetical protein